MTTKPEPEPEPVPDEVVTNIHKMLRDLVRKPSDDEEVEREREAKVKEADKNPYPHRLKGV